MALQALFPDYSDVKIPPLKQEKPVAGFSWRFMAVLLCRAV
ncbi:hypothetical protein [Candidatus Williamhamiltonella defendens]|nr:hypothetical protein [Candidatus Hamiltonella defensa]